jgi:hypothetical protein
MRNTLWVVALIATLGAGCATTDESYAVPALHKQASFDLACPASQLQIMETSQNTYGVKGCNKRTSYTLGSCNASTRECSFTRASPIEVDRT